jgi:hypothetical protein
MELMPRAMRVEYPGAIYLHRSYSNLRFDPFHGVGSGSTPSILLPWETEHESIHRVIDPMVSALKASKPRQRINVDDVIAVMQKGYEKAGLNDEAAVAVQWLNYVRK